MAASAFYLNGKILWAIALSILTFSLLYGPQNGIIASILGHKIFGPLGKLSYSLYLIHFPLFGVTQPFFYANY